MTIPVARSWTDWPWRLVLAVAGGVALLAVILATPGGRAAATGFLAQFRVQKFAIVTLDPQDPAAALASLERLGTVQRPDQPHPRRQVGSVEAVAERLGIAIKQPTTLPAGVAGPPQVMTAPPSEFSFTLDRAKATAYLAEQGQGDAVVPEALAGATLRVQIPASVALVYGDAGGQPSLVVAQVPTPTVDVSGDVSLADFRAFLLNVPGLPSDTVKQLRAIEDWAHTLPVPVPRDEAAARHITVAGAPGVSIRDARTQHGFILWQRDGIIFTIAGGYSEQDLQAVAESLR